MIRCQCYMMVSMCMGVQRRHLYLAASTTLQSILMHRVKAVLTLYLKKKTKPPQEMVDFIYSYFFFIILQYERNRLKHVKRTWISNYKYVCVCVCRAFV